jgi:hypothetical protein
MGQQGPADILGLFDRDIPQCQWDRSAHRHADIALPGYDLLQAKTNIDHMPGDITAVAVNEQHCHPRHISDVILLSHKFC